MNFRISSWMMCVKVFTNNCFLFLRSILKRDILRMKHLLHDAFCYNLRILNQYASIFDLICRHHICDRVYYVLLHKIDTLLIRCMCLLYVQIFNIYCIVINSTVLHCVSAIIMLFSIAFFQGGRWKGKWEDNLFPSHMWKEKLKKMSFCMWKEKKRSKTLFFSSFLTCFAYWF